MHRATHEVLQRCQELGFALAGVAEARPTRYEPQLRQWLDEGKHGEMHYLAQHIAQRIDPRAMVPGAKSIICVADRYDSGGADQSEPHRIDGRSRSSLDGETVMGSHDRPIGRIARYARGDDYHLVS